MVKDLERADIGGSATLQNSDAGRIGKKLFIFTKSRFSRILRLLVQTLMTLGLLLLVLRFTPNHMEGIPGTEHSSFFGWLPFFGPPAGPFNASAIGPSRMVVFGTPDVWTPTSGKGLPRPGWTEALCAELGCTSHESMILPIDLPTQALTSKSVYAEALRNMTNNGSPGGSGQNYDFVAEQYPVGDIPDLAAQVAKFLALPKPVPSPRETTWVFTFGTWDLWSLAALPRHQGNITIRAIAASIFDQVELLYAASMNPASPAYSDYYSYTRETSSILRAYSRNPSARPIESFRIIIPKLFDISLTPGWQTLRQEPPAPHTKAEHVKTAAFLAEAWDREIESRLAAWMNLPIAAKIREDQPMQNGRPYYGFWSPSKKEPSEGGGRRDVLYAPYPSRTGVQVNLGDFAKKAIIENQLRTYKLPGSDGRGTVDEADALYFENVDEPCVWHEKDTPTARRTATCEDPESHLFYGPFTLDEKAIRETARRATGTVIDVLYRGH